MPQKECGIKHCKPMLFIPHNSFQELSSYHQDARLEVTNQGFLQDHEVGSKKAEQIYGKKRSGRFDSTVRRSSRLHHSPQAGLQGQFQD